MTNDRDATVGMALAEVGEGHGSPGLMRYGVDERPALPAMLLFGLQHVLIMFGAMLAAPLIISQSLELPADVRAGLVSGVMFGCGVGTVTSALGLLGVGSRLPLLLGAYTAYVGPVVAISKAEGLGAASAAMLVGGAVLFAVSPLIGRLRALFPPVVVGTLLVVTGTTLAKVAVGVAFGVGTPFFGSPLTGGFLLLSTALVAVLASVNGGLVGPLSVSIAVVTVYIAGWAAGVARFGAVLSAPWFHVPGPLPYGLSWPSVGSLAIVVVYYFVAAIYTMSVTLALCTITGVPGTERRVRGAIAADGLGSMVAVLFGGLPLISYDQNVGAVSLTGVASRYVVAVSGAILVTLAFVPKVAALIGAFPPFVFGGILVFMFATIIAVGIRILAGVGDGRRDLVIIAASVGLSLAVDFAPPGAFDLLPPALKTLAGDGIVVGTLAAVILSSLLPGQDRVGWGR